MIKKISTTEDIKLFKKAIKKAIKDFVKNEECNMAGEFAIELLNEDDSYICRIVVRPILSNTCTPDLRVSNEDSIVIENFMYGNSFNINKYTSDYKLKKVADRIINIYNGKLDWEEEMERERRLDD